MTTSARVLGLAGATIEGTLGLGSLLIGVWLRQAGDVTPMPYLGAGSMLCAVPGTVGSVLAGRCRMAAYLLLLFSGAAVVVFFAIPVWVPGANLTWHIVPGVLLVAAGILEAKR
ncbi:MAG: hypothetical protein JXA87_15375 [Thermoleophilia bacterium]|nr:hypothetical protein [Thermoleophilia bacterium]